MKMQPINPQAVYESKVQQDNLMGEDYHGKLSKEDIAKLSDCDLSDGIRWHCGVLSELTGVLSELGTDRGDTLSLGMVITLLAEAERRADIISAYAAEAMERLHQARQVKAA